MSHGNLKKTLAILAAKQAKAMKSKGFHLIIYRGKITPEGLDIPWKEILAKALAQSPFSNPVT